MEWSGPAWYKVKKDEDGFPNEWKIVHFHPLNLGSHAATEWEAKDLASIVEETYALMPSLSNAYMGLIHSHNTMGAFLSGTDTGTIQDMAPDEGFYGSLVVASSGKALHAFGFGYKDQYKVSHCLEADEDDIQILSPGFTPLAEWISEADIIEKNKPKPVVGQQTSLLGGYGRTYPSVNSIVETRPTKQTVAENRKKIMNKLPLKKQLVLSNLFNRLDEEAITEVDFEVKAEALGLSVADILKLYDDDAIFNYGYNYGGWNVGI